MKTLHVSKWESQKVGDPAPKFPLTCSLTHSPTFDVRRFTAICYTQMGAN